MKTIIIKVFGVIGKILFSKQAKRFYWLTFASFVGIILSGIADLGWISAGIAMALTASFTKEVNNYLIKNKGV